MVAKGVDFYLYSGADDLLTDVAGPKVSSAGNGPSANFKRQNLQISSANIPGFFNYVGRLEWVTRRSGVDMIRLYQNISSLTGLLHSGEMRDMFNSPPRLEDPAVSWGFYDAGSGRDWSILTNQNQLYIYATRERRRWMTELAARDPRIAHGPFARFALPGAHNAGMFDMRAVRRILNTPALYAALMGSMLLIPVIGPALGVAGAIGRAFAPRAIANLSMNQKDNIRAMLDLGTRYFDFRPGTMHPRLRAFTPGVRYHQHKLVPGQPYVEFLSEVLRWLDGNPGEIVVVSANTQGFMDDTMRPTPDDLVQDLRDATARVHLTRAIEIGDKRHLGESYEALVRANRRLLFLNQVAGETRKYDSWNGELYATLRPEPIIQAFERMSATMPQGHDYVVMQMQATATELGEGVIIPSVITTSDASSPLLATKAVIDAATNPWLRRHAASRLPRENLLVLLNDFNDNCMVDTAIEVTQQRARD